MEFTYQDGELIGEGRKTLVVEDDPAVSRIVERVLKQRGHEVRVTAGGDEAWDLYQAELYPLVILDWMLPGLSGVEVCKRMRSLPRAKYTTILMITGKTAPEDQAQALEAGVDDYLVKPFSVQLLNVRLAVAEERVRDRVARRLADAQRRDVEETFHHLFARFPEIVFRIDEEGRFTYLNEAVGAIGYKPEELVGEHFSAILHPEDAERVSRERVLPSHVGRVTGDEEAPKLFDERRTGLRGTTELEVRLRSRDGVADKQGVWDRIGEVTACGVYDSTRDEPERRFVGSLGIVRDITRRRQAEAALIRSERLAAVGTLASGVAHEFNNLNVAILGYADVLRQAGDIPAEQRERADVIFRAASAARRITDKLLTFTRDRRSERGLHDLNAVVRDTVDLMTLTLEREEVEVTLEPGDAPPAPFNEGEISQVLLNFLVNARHALDGRPRRQVKIRTGVEDGRVFAAVADTGCGIPEEEINQIFTPFHTTRGKRSAAGTPGGEEGGAGLGLSVCDGIVRRHGGEITVRSEVDRGSVFTIWLPVEAARSEAADGPDLVGVRTLILEGGAFVTRLLQETFTESGGVVQVVPDLDGCAARLAGEPFDLFVLDLDRLAGRGDDVAAAVAGAVKAGQPAPSILGVCEQEGGEPESALPPIAGMLVKPFGRERILQAAFEALEGRAAGLS